MKLIKSKLLRVCMLLAILCVLNIASYAEAQTGKSDLGDASDSTNNFGRVMSAYPSSHTGLPNSIRANFPTVYNDGSGSGPYGPFHINNRLVAYLGRGITRETEADTGPDEDSSNNIFIHPQGHTANRDGGDDGVYYPDIDLPRCCWTTFEFEVTVVDPSVDLWFNAWFDWNRDGDWDDVEHCSKGPAPEWAVQNQFLGNLPAGVNRITSRAFLPWHPDGVPDQIWMRLTLAEQPWKTGSSPGQVGNAGSGPRDKYLYGETEDYYFIPDRDSDCPDDSTCPICKDYNGDGKIDMDDLILFTEMWLDDCPE